MPETASGSGAELSFGKSNRYEQVRIDMMSASMVYNVLFRRLLEAVRLSSEDNKEGVHVVIVEPPYNSRRTVELSSSKHNR